MTVRWRTGHAIDGRMKDGWHEPRMKLGGSRTSMGRLDLQLLRVMIIRQVPCGKFEKRRLALFYAFDKGCNFDKNSSRRHILKIVELIHITGVDVFLNEDIFDVFNEDIFYESALWQIALRTLLTSLHISWWRRCKRARPTSPTQPILFSYSQDRSRPFSKVRCPPFPLGLFYADVPICLSMLHVHALVVKLGVPRAGSTSKILASQGPKWFFPKMPPFSSWYSPRQESITVVHDLMSFGGCRAIFPYLMLFSAIYFSVRERDFGVNSLSPNSL